MAGLQLTSLVHAVQRWAGARSESAPPVPLAVVARVEEVVTRVLAGFSSPEMDRWGQLVADRPDAEVVLRRGLAATRRLAAVVELAEHWDAWTSAERAAVIDPIGILSRDGRQTDQTTCGSASLVMLAAAGDPGLAGWLAAGTVPAVSPPPELGAADRAQLVDLAAAPAAARFGVLQRVVKHRSNARSVLGLPWPASLGTPPWGAAREARFLDVRFEQRLLTDTDFGDLSTVLRRVGLALDAGIPVPLYAGGDTARGWATAIPRHVVLAVARRPDGFLLWEPSAGALLGVRTADLLHGGMPSPALGGWSHLMWAVLPR